MSLCALCMRNTYLHYQSTVRRRQYRIYCPVLVHSDIEVHVRDFFFTFHIVLHAYTYSLTATVLKSKIKSISIQVNIYIRTRILKLFSCSCSDPRCRTRLISIQISNIADHELSRRARHDDHLDSGHIFTRSGRDNLQRCVQTLICLASVSSYIHPSRARARSR